VLPLLLPSPSTPNHQIPSNLVSNIELFVHADLKNVFTKQTNLPVPACFLKLPVVQNNHQVHIKVISCICDHHHAEFHPSGNFFETPTVGTSHNTSEKNLLHSDTEHVTSIQNLFSGQIYTYKKMIFRRQRRVPLFQLNSANIHKQLHNTLLNFPVKLND